MALVDLLSLSVLHSIPRLRILLPPQTTHTLLPVNTLPPLRPWLPFIRMSKVLHRIRTVCLLPPVPTVLPMYMLSRLRLRRLKSFTKLLLLASALLLPVAIAGDGRYVER